MSLAGIRENPWPNQEGLFQRLHIVCAQMTGTKLTRRGARVMLKPYGDEILGGDKWWNGPTLSCCGWRQCRRRNCGPGFSNWCIAGPKLTGKQSTWSTNKSRKRRLNIRMTSGRLKHCCGSLGHRYLDYLEDLQRFCSDDYTCGVHRFWFVQDGWTIEDPSGLNKPASKLFLVCLAISRNEVSQYYLEKSVLGQRGHWGHHTVNYRKWIRITTEAIR